ncbi:hypothetical protein H0H92_006184 [Tricholoma furcatifolium]|nr:hypothetical protein H0H92_006184 [Tricholoma furcatifolium]
MSSHNASLATTTTEITKFPTEDESPIVAGSSQEAVASEPHTPPDEVDNKVEELVWWQRCHRKAQTAVEGNTGLLLITAAQAFFSLMNVAVKTLNSIDPPVSPLQLIVVRMGITYFCSLFYMLATKVPDPVFGPKGIRLLLVFRGFSGFFGLFGIYYSLQYLSLSDATVLTFLAPLFSGIAGAIFLKENYTKAQALASSRLRLILAHPPSLIADPAPADLIVNEIDYSALVAGELDKVTPEQRLMAVGCAMLGVLGATGACKHLSAMRLRPLIFGLDTSIAAMGKRAHPMHAMLAFSSQSTIVAGIGMAIQGTPIVIPARIEWLMMLLMIGGFGFIAQALLTMGLQRDALGRGSIAVYTQIVFAGLLERFFFKVEPSYLSLFGTLIIVSSALYVAVTKENAKKRKPSDKLSGLLEGALEEGLLDGPSENQGAGKAPSGKSSSIAGQEGGSDSRVSNKASP